ncbi:MAG: hypothetical protein M5U07_16945, partial [Xanthobacteraceae bacterium]|nr:hypothetical protein [Xanthobacteraceae bacterium]
MRQVRAHDDERLRAAPQPVDHLGHLARARRTDHEGHQRELAQHFLQERQLDLERVLLCVRGPVLAYLRQRARGRHRLEVHRNRTERGLEGFGVGQREAAHRHPVAGPEQDDPLHHAARRAQQNVGVGRDRSG